VSIQIFGGDPETMADAAQIVEGIGADIVDVNMGCPVQKIAKHNAGCSLMREPEHAARVISAMTKAVKIPVTVKMRAGWNDRSRNAPELARMVQDAGAAAVTIHGRTAEQSYRGLADWDLVSHVAETLEVPVLGSGDCVEPQQILDRLATGVSGVLVGRGVLRNPWILAQAADMAAGLPPRHITNAERAQFLLDYITLLLNERVDESAGFRHVAPQHGDLPVVHMPARGRERWVINKLRALCAWYSKGLEGGAQFRTTVNGVESVQQLVDTIHAAFVDEYAMMTPAPPG
jgi:tRNA-dihydrouridine synthase B